MEHNAANLLPFHVADFALGLIFLVLFDAADRVLCVGLFCCHA